MKASYIALAVFSLILALIFIFYFAPLVELSSASEGKPDEHRKPEGLSSVRDLVLVTTFFLILDAVLSLILAFAENKVKPSEQAERKG